MMGYDDSCYTVNWKMGVRRNKALLCGSIICSKTVMLWPAGNPQHMGDQAGMLQRQKEFAIGLNENIKKNTTIRGQEISPEINMVIGRTM